MIRISGESVVEVIPVKQGDAGTVDPCPQSSLIRFLNDNELTQDWGNIPAPEAQVLPPQGVK